MISSHALLSLSNVSYNPALISEGKNPFILDSKKLRREVTNFLKREGRFVNLKRKHPEIADDLFNKMNNDVHHRMELMMSRAAGYKSFSSKDEASVQVLFASETGTAQRVARDFADACILSHGADSLADVDIDDVNGTTTIFFVATCGQGSMPQNAKSFYKALCARQEPFDKGTKFSVMGLGDSKCECVFGVLHLKIIILTSSLFNRLVLLLLQSCKGYRG
jgi:sulfite reductase alpha subunit-like flavoprotein